jgi:hypothetical protein
VQVAAVAQVLLVVMEYQMVLLVPDLLVLLWEV